MGYVRRTWKNGEVITDEKLNNIEEGIAEAKSEAAHAKNAAETAAAKAMTPYEYAKKNGYTGTEKDLNDRIQATALPNPYSLTLGSKKYDGSAAVQVGEIELVGTDEAGNTHTFYVLGRTEG